MRRMGARAKAVFVVVILATASVACSRGEPPTADAAGQSPSTAPLASSLAAMPSAAPAAAASSTAQTTTPSASASAEVEPGKLPQTKDKPEPQGAAFDARVAGLWKAIVDDSPDAAMPFFFPVDAYIQIKDIPKPQNDWNARLVAAYKRDIHALHQRLGSNADNATFVKLDVPNERARWVNPHEELNTGGYWRVYGTKLRYEIDGKEKSFDVASLISWRGEWYVVHLAGFK
jgi:hypothetical protein